MTIDNLGKALNESSAAKGKKKNAKGSKDPLGGLVNALNSSQQGGAGNLDSLLGADHSAPPKPAQPAAQQPVTASWQDPTVDDAPAQPNLGSLLGGLSGADSSSSGMGGLGSLLGMLGGGQSSQSAGPGGSSGMGGLGSLLGMLGGGQSSQSASPFGLVSSGTGSPFDALAAPLAKKLGIPVQLASLIIMFVANSLLGGKKANRSGQIDTARVADVSQVMDWAERGQTRQGGLGNNQLVQDLSRETGLDEETSARSIHELMQLLNQGATE